MYCICVATCVFELFAIAVPFDDSITGFMTLVLGGITSPLGHVVGWAVYCRQIIDEV